MPGVLKSFKNFGSELGHMSKLRPKLWGGEFLKISEISELIYCKAIELWHYNWTENLSFSLCSKVNRGGIGIYVIFTTPRKWQTK
jgi:hypothetical protein